MDSAPHKVDTRSFLLTPEGLRLPALQTPHSSDSQTTVRAKPATITLRGDRSLVINENTLVVADLHLGKEEVFQSHGVAVPSGSSETTLERLRAIVQNEQIDELVVLGDILHDPRRLEAGRLAELLEKLAGLASRVRVVLGNHDRLESSALKNYGIDLLADGARRGALRLTHAAHATAGAVTLGGHVHPVARVRAPGERLRLPCFVASPRVIVLPAFGSMSGGWEVNDEPSSVRLACFHGALLEIDASRMTALMT